MRQPLVAVLDYGIGNLRSAQKALEYVGAGARLTSDPGFIGDADGVVLPGVGAFGRCAEAVRESGLFDVAADAAGAAAEGSGPPFLGICIGMQLLYARSEESPGVTGLGVLDGTVRRLPDGVKHPQMQWNTLEATAACPLLEGIAEPAWMYFVHSFAPEASAEVVATCDYGGPVTALVQRGRLWATQFHPEKSSTGGLALLGNFVAACRQPAAVR